MPELTSAQVRDAQIVAESIVNTVRSPLVVLDGNLRVVSANTSFLQTFQVSERETVGQPVYKLGNGQWDIPKLRELLDTIIPQNTQFHDFEVEHDFPVIGFKHMLLNAQRLGREGGRSELILLAIEDVTERMLIRHALEDSEAKYHKFVENLNSIIIGFDTEGAITFFNHFAEKLFGYSREEMLGKNFVGTIVPRVESSGKDNSGLVAGVVRHPEQHYINENEGMKRNGERILFSWSAKDVRDRQGNVVEILVDGNDLSPVREQIAAARKAYAMLDGSPDIIAEIDTEGRYLYVNKSMEQVVGRSRSEIVGKHTGEFGASEETVAAQRHAFSKAAETRRQESYEAEYGGRALQTLVVPDFDRHGAVSSFMTFARDVTERKKAEEKLRENEKRFSALHAASSEVLYRMSPDWSIMYQLSSRDFLANTERPNRNWLKEYIPEDEQERVTAAIRKAISEKSVFQLEHKVIQAGGSIGWTFSRAVPLFNEKGEINEWFGAANDFTGRKRAEEALHKERELLRTIIDSIPVMLTVYDPDARHFQVNKHFEQVTGWSHEDATQDLPAKVYPDVKEREEALQFMQSLAPGWCDVVMTAKDGSRIESSWANIKLPDGRQVGIGLDIRERKQAEIVLRESEELFNAFFNASPFTMDIFDGDLRYVKLNREGEKVLGKTADEVIGRVLPKIAPGFIDQVRGPFETVLRTGQAMVGIEVQGESLTEPGKTVYFQISCFPVPLSGGRKGLGVVANDVTQAKEAERELRRSDEIIRSVSSAILTTDRDGNITYINDFGLKFFGYTRDELMGKNVITMLVPERESTGRALYPLTSAIIKNPDQSQNFVNENIKKNGERVWVSWTNRSIRDAEGHLAGVFTVGNDITLLKKAENEAAEGQRTLAALMDNIPEGIFIGEPPEGRLLLVSRYMTELTGVPREEFKGLTDPEIRSRMRMQEASLSAATKQLPLVRAVRDGEVVVDDEWIINPPGRNPVDVLINARPIRDGNGAIIAGVSSWRDITGRKKAEDTLRRNEYELRTLVDNSPDIIFRLNRQLRYTYVNPAYERITGLAKDQFRGKANNQLGMSRQMVEFWQSAVQPVIEGGREHLLEFDMTGFFGQRYFSARLIPEFAKSGLVETVLVIARDITERKRAEEQMRYVSFHDEVTHLFNRAFFEEEIRRIDTERDLPVSIIMGDVNNLKLTNDVFGHDEGDNLLKAIADSIRKACRQSDIVARWGGDEFAVILPKTDFVTADGICARISEITRENKGTVLPPSVAVGIATKERGDQNIYLTIRQAEQNMYNYKLDHAEENRQTMLSVLVNLVREKTPDYCQHVDRIYELAGRFGDELRLPEDQQRDLRMLVELHDIGDVVVPGDILTKPGRLTIDEWDVMKKHVEAGFRIVKTYADTARISDEVLSHGEHWDGTGYQRGLKGKDIPYLARVFAIIDAFDAMTHPRPYAPTFTREEAAEELRRNAGRQFDPEMVRVFIDRVLLSGS